MRQGLRFAVANLARIRGIHRHERSHCRRRRQSVPVARPGRESVASARSAPQRVREQRGFRHPCRGPRRRRVDRMLRQAAGRSHSSAHALQSDRKDGAWRRQHRPRRRARAQDRRSPMSPTIAWTRCPTTRWRSCSRLRARFPTPIPWCRGADGRWRRWRPSIDSGAKRWASWASAISLALLLRRPRRSAFEVLAYDPFVAQDAFASLGVEGVGFDALLASSDFVSVHAPLTPQTRGLLNAGALAKMKPGALIINTARGPLIDEKALIAALDSGRLGGAALDVLETEPPPKDSPLIGRANVVLTPHTAFYSVEALEELQTKCATDVGSRLVGAAAGLPGARSELILEHDPHRVLRRRVEDLVGLGRLAERHLVRNRGHEPVGAQKIERGHIASLARPARLKSGA